ncbi:KTSC domain-containing protein [Burkholderia gladioli]|uniref:KTSC domain-containing protein n=1 Tax=Burkholderia gladioli TaxID=28095 RepID=UPI00163E5FC4|nr:KTSC domain-containing protein [Burkholderia gladioli]
MKNIDTKPVESSQVHSIGYDAETETLAVRFKDRRNGSPTSLYHYSKFTHSNFNALHRAASIGAYLHRHIKPFPERLPYTCIETMPDVPAVDEVPGT